MPKKKSGGSSRDSVIPNGIIGLISNSKKLKDNFSINFLKKYFAFGFGSLSKKEIDLLIFDLLSRETNILQDLNYFEISNFLMIPEQKIKNLILESHLKYGTKNIDSEKSNIIKKIKSGDFPIELSNESLQIKIDSPIYKRSFEHILDANKIFFDYSFHSGVLKVNLAKFFKAFKNFEETSKLEKKVRTELKKDVSADRKTKKEINDCTMRDLLKKFGSKISNAALQTITAVVVETIHTNMQ